MDVGNLLGLASKLIEIPSVTGDEKQVVDFVESQLRSWDLAPERLNVEGNRDNLFVSCGVPEVVFTTHLDVVPAPDAAFRPRIANDRLYGRGACDAKGIAAVMMEVCRTLKGSGASNFGLLLVVDEEVSGLGARSAAQALKDRGIRFLVNGEPTGCVLASRQNGVFDFRASFKGIACHSGCPKNGEDANQKLLNAWMRLASCSEEDLRSSGIALVNSGKILAGVAANVISPAATMDGCVRTSAVNNDASKRFLEELLQADDFEITFDCPAFPLFVPEGWENKPVSFGSDLPNFSELKSVPLLFGPGSIAQAHTDDEFVAISQLELAFRGYCDLYNTLQQTGAVDFGSLGRSR